MAEDQTERRLAAILVADVVNYSGLMEADEVGTLSALQQRRTSIVEPVIRDHAGRIVKFMGDGVLVEFSSAVNAVKAGLLLQDKFVAANNSLPDDRQINLRIGINLCDILEDGADIYGDGVNIAARLQALASPAGLCIASNVYDAVRGKVVLPAGDMCDVELKNIKNPIRVYQIASTKVPASKVRAIVAGHEKPSIAVLPFVNLGGVAEDDSFADGLTEDIITALSYCNNLLVIARTSVFAYKGKTGDIKKIARELSVDYVMEGSVRRSGDRVRVTAQLIEAATGHHAWAEKYDGTTDKIFEIQDDITRAVAASTNAQIFLSAWQARRRSTPGSEKAHALALAAIGRLMDTNSDAYAEGMELAQAALSADPALPAAHFARLTAFLNQLSEGDVPHDPDTVACALAWADEVLRIAPNDEQSYWLKGWALAKAGRLEEAVAACEHGILINPNLPMLLGDVGIYYAALGRADEAIAACKLSLRLSPRDPAVIWRQYGLASAYFVSGQYHEAHGVAQKVARVVKGFVKMGLLWAASAAALEKLEDARSAVAHCLAQRSELNLRSIWPQYMIPYARPADQAMLVSMLRKAGIPE